MTKEIFGDVAMLGGLFLVQRFPVLYTMVQDMYMRVYLCTRPRALLNDPRPVSCIK